MSRAREFADLASSADAGGITGKNLIINGSMICSQRGTSGSYSANTSRGYVLDRWYGEGYPLNATIAQSTLAYDGITYECASLSSITGTYYFYQPVEDGVKYNKGKNLVLSFVASGSGNIQCQYNAGTVGTVNVGSAVTLTGTPTKYSVAFTLSGSATGDHLYIGFNGSGGSFNVSLVQLEVGEQATPFEHRSFGDELARCRRYCNVIAPNVAYAHYGFVGFCESSTKAKVLYTFPVEMRATPSFTRSGSFVYDGASANPTFSSVDNIALTPTNCRIEDVVSSGTTGQGVILINDNDASATIKFDAEL